MAKLWREGDRISGVPLCQFFICIEIITNYNNKNFGLLNALKERLKGSRKWSITTTNHNRSKQRHEPIRIPCKLLVTCWKREKNRANKTRLVLVSLLIGWKIFLWLFSDYLENYISIREKIISDVNLVVWRAHLVLLNFKTVRLLNFKTVRMQSQL